MKIFKDKLQGEIVYSVIGERNTYCISAKFTKNVIQTRDYITKETRIFGTKFELEEYYHKKFTDYIKAEEI